jgi:hypothetical protein
MRYDIVQNPTVGTDPTNIGPYTIDWGDRYPGDTISVGPTFSLTLGGEDSTDATIHDISFSGLVVSFWILNVSPVVGSVYTLTNHVNMSSGVSDYRDLTLWFV